MESVRLGDDVSVAHGGSFVFGLVFRVCLIGLHYFPLQHLGSHVRTNNYLNDGMNLFR